MMKLTTAINSVIAGLLVIPAVTSQVPTGGVREALESTVAAVEELRGLGEQLANGDKTAVARVLAVTEAPIMGPRERDEFLVTLREEVNGLRMTVEEKNLEPPPRSAAGTGTNPSSRATAGLGDELRGAIAAEPLPLATISPNARRVPAGRAFEPEGFSADLLHQGRLFFRAGRYAEALTLLEAVPDTEATYWLGRCYEKLERPDDAIDLYQRIVNDEPGSSLARRAQHDLDFLSWKRDYFQRKRKEGQK